MGGRGRVVSAESWEGARAGKWKKKAYHIKGGTQRKVE